MNDTRINTDFFVTGGPLSASAPSYVTRTADEELYRLLQRGQFAYVLTSRQMGKSSLMNRTAKRLREAGVASAILDLSAIDHDMVEMWYLGMVVVLCDELDLDIDAEAWWGSSNVGPVQRFQAFLRDVMLTKITGQVVIFIDEIDTTLSIAFSDEFFAAIRSIYNARERIHAFQRLSIVLLGAASPTDLIKNPRLTPFNIAEGILLQDFKLDEAAHLQEGLEAALPGQGNRIFQPIYQWTNGHPYLTQRFCKLVIDQGKVEMGQGQIDEIAKENFLSESARGEANSRDVQDRILNHPQQRQLLGLYRRIVKGRRIADDPHSVVQNQLKLSGLVKSENGYLQIRNRIYADIFDDTWVRIHTKINWARVIAIVSTLIAVIAISIIVYDFYWIETQKNAAYKKFDEANSSAEQMHQLAQLFSLRGIIFSNSDDSLALDKFLVLSPKRQLELFKSSETAFSSNDLIKVTKKLYGYLADIDNTGSTTPLLIGIMDALESLHTNQIESMYQQSVFDQLEKWGFRQDSGNVAFNLQQEIKLWLEGRRLVQTGRFVDALESYNTAISLNPLNPATLYERARVSTNLKRYSEALRDLDQVISIAKLAPTPTPIPTAFIAIRSSNSISPISPLATNKPVQTSIQLVSPLLTPILVTETNEYITTGVQINTLTQTQTPFPTSILTQSSNSIIPEFINIPQRVQAVRDLVNLNPGLAVVLIASASQYPNLADFDMIPAPTQVAIGLSRASQLTLTSIIVPTLRPNNITQSTAQPTPAAGIWLHVQNEPSSWIAPGEETVYTIRYENRGSVTVQDLQIFNTIPIGVEVVEDSIQANIGKFAINRVSSASSAIIIWTIGEAITQNSGELAYRVRRQFPPTPVVPLAISIEVTAPAIANVGEEITYTLKVTNNTPIPLSNLMITNTIPYGAVYLRGADRRPADNIIEWLVPVLDAKSTTTVQYVVMAKESLVNYDYLVVSDEGASSSGRTVAVTRINNQPPLIGDTVTIINEGAIATWKVQNQNLTKKSDSVSNP